MTRESTQKGRFRCVVESLRLVVTLFLMMVVGVNTVWGQTVDYSGTWYINNQRLPNAGYYFVPTINCFYNGDEDQPHLTTFKTGKDKNSIWRIESVSVGSDTYYRIIHNATGKYLMANAAIQELANSSAAHRKRVHLETLSSQDIANLDSDPSTDKSLFYFTVIDATNKIIAIKPKNVGSSVSGEGSNHLYLNPRGNTGDEFDSYRAADGRGITNVNGIVGFWGNDSSNQPSTNKQPGSCWKLETATNTCANPVIKYIEDDTKIEISYPISTDTGWKIYYTTDGSDPNDATNGNRTEIDATAILTNLTDVTKVRAIATKTDWENSEESILIASGVTQMVQSKDCNAFYIVPPIVDSDKYATTTNIPNERMGWNFVPDGLYCGIQYYKIVNKSNNKYLYCNATKSSADQAFEMKNEGDLSSYEQIDRAKFRLIVQTDGSYKIISKWWAAENVTSANGYYVNKKNGNNGGNPLNLADGSSNTGQWNVIAAPTTPKTQFDASFASTTTSMKCYLIKSANDATYHLLPPVAANGNATANTTGANPNWFLLPVVDNDEWIPYYYIKNGKTGEYLYFNNSNSQFYASSTIESGNEDKYKFIIVKSANTTYANAYNIIPYALKDQTNQTNNSLKRNNTTLTKGDSRNTAETLWQFEEVCLDPIFEQSGETFVISYISSTSNVYYTTDGTDPSTSGTLYGSDNWPVGEKRLIKAIAKLKDNESVVSGVVTLLNKPDITLKEGESVVDENTYTYDGSAKTPTPSKVYIGTTETTAGFALASTDPYLNNTNAGTATVNVDDNDATDNWYIWNASTTFTINRKALTITAGSETKAYDGTALTKNSFTNTDLATGDAIESVTITGSQTDKGASNNVPSAAVIKKGETDVTANYNITYVNGTLTVTAKPVTVTADNAEKVYDGTALTKNTATASGLIEGHSLASVTVTGSQTIVGNSNNVPSAAVIKKDETDVTANYEITYANGTLEVTQKALTITAGSDTKVYDGTALTKNSYTNTELAEGDNITSVTVTGSQTAVGTSDNVPSAAVIKNGNGDEVTTCYEITYTNGTLTVNGMALTITAGSDTKVYDGTALTKNSYTNTALSNGDVLESVTVTGSQTAAGNSANVPSAAVIKKGETDVTGNYAINYVNGTLTVTQKAITVKADNKSKEYLAEDPTLTATATGLIGEDVVAFNTPIRTEGEDVGSYTITVSGEASQGNYTVTYDTGTFTITKKALGLGDANKTPASGINIEISKNGDTTNPYTVTVTYDKISDEDKTLVEGEDYEIPEGNEYDEENNHIVIIKGKEDSNYSGEAKVIYINLSFHDDTPDDDIQTETAAVYCASSNLQPSEDVEAWYVSAVDVAKREVIIKRVETTEGENYIPAAEPVLLLGDAVSTGFMLKQYTGTTVDITGNKLQKVTADDGIAVPDKGLYVFYQGEFVLAMWGAEKKIKKDNFYIDLTGSGNQAPSRMRIVKDETNTGIREIADDGTIGTQHETWYTIDGQKLNKKPTRKGLYIQNGNKRIVK